MTMDKQKSDIEEATERRLAPIKKLSRDLCDIISLLPDDMTMQCTREIAVMMVEFAAHQSARHQRSGHSEHLFHLAKDIDECLQVARSQSDTTPSPAISDFLMAYPSTTKH